MTSYRKVSIIIPVYNRLDYLKDLFGSIDKLSLKDIGLEVIVIDNASTEPFYDFIRLRAEDPGCKARDECEQAALRRMSLNSVEGGPAEAPKERRRVDKGTMSVKAWGSIESLKRENKIFEVIYKRLESGLNPASAKNIGASLAKGDYLWFLDSDTEILFPDTLQDMLAIAEKNSSIKIIGGEFISHKKELYFNDHCFYINFLFKNNFVHIDRFKQKYMYCIASSNLFIGKGIFTELGGYNEELPLFEDNDFCLKADKKRYRIFSAKNICVLHKLSAAGRGDSDNAYKNIFCYTRKFHKTRIELLYSHNRFSLLILPILDFFIGVDMLFSGIKNRIKPSYIISEKFGCLIKPIPYCLYHILGMLQGYLGIPALFLKHLKPKSKNSFWRNIYLREDVFKRIAFPVFISFPGWVKNPILDAHIKIQRRNIRMQNSYKLIFFVTNQCGLRCRHCFYKHKLDTKMDELTLDEIAKISRSMKDKIYCLHLTGGEPFLRKDIEKICILFRRNSNCRTVYFSTNGFMPGLIKEKMDYLLRNSDIIFNFCISLDGIGRIHNDLRGNESAFSNFQDTAQVLAEFKRSHPGRIKKLVAVTTFNKLNIGSAREVIGFMRTLDGFIHCYTIMRSSQLHTFGVAKENISDNQSDPELLLSLNQIKELYRVYEQELWLPNLNSFDYRMEKEKHRMTIDTLIDRSPLECMSGYLDITLYPDGQMTRCEMLKPIGNIRQAGCDFNKFTETDAWKGAFKETGKCSCIHDCSLVSAFKLNRIALRNIFRGSRIENSLYKPRL